MSQNSLRLYIISHWRGSLSLAKSYWLNCFLLTLPFYSFARIAESANPNDPRPLFVALALTLVLWVPVYVWQVVGTWRASETHIRSTARHFWARSVQALIVLGIPVNLFNVLNTGAMIWVVTPLVLGRDPMDTAHVYLDQANHLVRVDGEIGFGAADRIVELIKQGSVQHVSIQSRGGRTGASLMVAHLLEIHPEITVTVDGVCASACVLLLAGGNERMMTLHSHILFHAPTAPLASTSKNFGQQETDLEKDYLKKRGFSSAIVDRGYTSTEPYVPTVHELLNGGVITRVIAGGDNVGPNRDPR